MLAADSSRPGKVIMREIFSSGSIIPIKKSVVSVEFVKLIAQKIGDKKTNLIGRIGKVLVY